MFVVGPKRRSYHNSQVVQNISTKQFKMFLFRLNIKKARKHVMFRVYFAHELACQDKKFI